MNKMKKLITCKKHFLHYIIIFLAITLCHGCTTTTQTFYLYHEKDHASLITSRDVDIVKIDSRIVSVKYDGESGTIYSKVVIKPGRHEIVVYIPWFREGSVVFMEAFFRGGREYIVKYKIGDRVSLLSRAWRFEVWIEDCASGDIVSKTIRNI